MLTLQLQVLVLGQKAAGTGCQGQGDRMEISKQHQRELMGIVEGLTSGNTALIVNAAQHIYQLLEDRDRLAEVLNENKIGRAHV